MNYDILTRNKRTMCLCTGMLYDPAWEKAKKENESAIKKRSLLDIIKRLKPMLNGKKSITEGNKSEKKSAIGRILGMFY